MERWTIFTKCYIGLDELSIRTAWLIRGEAINADKKIIFNWDDILKRGCFQHQEHRNLWIQNNNIALGRSLWSLEHCIRRSPYATVELWSIGVQKYWLEQYSVKSRCYSDTAIKAHRIHVCVWLDCYTFCCELTEVDLKTYSKNII